MTLEILMPVYMERENYSHCSCRLKFFSTLLTPVLAIRVIDRCTLLPLLRGRQFSALGTSSWFTSVACFCMQCGGTKRTVSINSLSCRSEMMYWTLPSRRVSHQSVRTYVSRKNIGKFIFSNTRFFCKVQKGFIVVVLPCLRLRVLLSA